jgi:metal-dependent amidase/aminoacylase/carboxypeptidase family protein
MTTLRKQLGRAGLGLALALAGLAAATAAAAEPAPLTPVQHDLLRHLDAIRPELVAINQDIWTFAELGLEEHRSAARLVGVLKKAGFRIKEGVSGMPTAFVAEYGSGKPDTDCHEVVPNLPLSKLIHRNLTLAGPPRFDDADRDFARRLQEPLRGDFGLKETKPLNDTIEDVPGQPYPEQGGSSDVGDVSWHVPTGGLDTACFAAGSPGHSWQNVAAIGSPIGHKGMLVAAKVLALTAADLLQDPKALEEAGADFRARMKDRKYTTRVPKGQKPPRTIR